MKYVSIRTRPLILLCALLFSFSFDSLAGKNKTPKYWKCYHRVGGTWDLGHAPKACDSYVFLDNEYAEMVYGDFFYQDANHGTDEMLNYVNLLHPTLRDYAAYYIKKRKPNVSEREIKEWQHAVFAVAHIESYWTHYRRGTDNRLKVMRGDSGHGHGLMQIDDRWHFARIKDGTAWDLFSNMTYALDIYYMAWKKAPNTKCIKRPNEWRNRARAAYSAYNGGLSNLCRWTNPYSKWSAIDRHFERKYDGKGWERYIEDLDATAPIDVGCVIEGNENCSNSPANPEVPDVPVENIVYQTDDGKLCVFAEEQFICLNEDSQRDAVCLQGWTEEQLSENWQSMPEKYLENYELQSFDRGHICSAESLNLVPVGQSIELQKSINMRHTAGGILVGTLPSGSIVQVLDFEIRKYDRLNRYYYVKYGSKKGYIYAGNKHTFNEWASASHTPAEQKEIANIGDTIRLKKSINLRKSVGGNALTTVPKGSNVEVIDVKIIGNNKKVYYKISYKGRTGYVYGGRVLPTKTLQNWAVIEK